MPNTFGPALARNPNFVDLDGSAETLSQLESFRLAPTKVAIQKDGALTDIARTILLDGYGLVVPARPEKTRLDIGVSDDGQTGFVHARNKAICGLVASGAVHMAIVGTDRLIEDEVEDRVDIVASFRDQFSWSLVLATPASSSITSPEQISRVATQYPVITQRFFGSLGCNDVEIIPSAGGTELYPYLDYDGKPVDAIVDLVSTGQTMAAHNLIPWKPAIGTIYPVLIRARQS
ncbi:MAG TPA: ATP phosphoribosyltransferase [Candidatus Saccharimonadales bacterium]|nr:ATP phosphoribosyltransferase [Candidatus Saccharimonadales bacterium]